jgi:hypothetical protein
VLAFVLFAEAVFCQVGSVQMTCSGAPAASPENMVLPENFLPICTDPNATKYIRVAIHYLLPTRPVKQSWKDGCTTGFPIVNYVGPGNFTETGDGFTTNGPNGYTRAEVLMRTNIPSRYVR